MAHILGICGTEHLKTGPFDDPIHIYHLNTGLVQCSDGYCILKQMDEDREKHILTHLQLVEDIKGGKLSNLKQSFDVLIVDICRSLTVDICRSLSDHHHLHYRVSLVLKKYKVDDFLLKTKDQNF